LANWALNKRRKIRRHRNTACLRTLLR